MLAPLDNETIFKKAFTHPVVFKQFVKDILGIEMEVGKIETEKKFKPKVGHIDFAFDIFAESTDHRIVVEIQRIDYDYNFDRFLHYFMMAIAQMQQSAQKYEIDRTVYTIIVLTAPYKLDREKWRGVQDEVLITSVDPRNLNDKIIPIYGHKLVFLNPHYRKNNTPSNYRDWLDLFYQSIHDQEEYTLNMNNEGIRKAVELINYENIDGESLHLMKIQNQRKVVLSMEREEGRTEGRAEGIKAEKINTVKNALAEGFTREQIARLTGLPPDAIDQIIREVDNE